MKEFFQLEQLKYWQEYSANLHAYFSRTLYRQRKAFDLVLKIATDRTAWRASDPVEIYDSDIVLNSSLLDIPVLLKMNQKLLTALDAYACELDDRGEYAKAVFTQLDDFIIG